MLGYAREDLLQASSLERTCCVDAMAERLPVRDGTVDMVLSINMLDHTFQPEKVVDEMWRVLRPGGQVHLNVDVGGLPNACEPVVFSEESLRALFARFQPIHADRREASNPGREHMVVAIFSKPDPAGDADAEDGPRDYLDVLRCPDCGGALARADQALSCGGCGRRHPVERGVWVLRPQG